MTQSVDGGGESFGSPVDFVLGGEPAESEADTAAHDIDIESQGSEHVTGFRIVRGTSAPGREGDFRCRDHEC